MTIQTLKDVAVNGVIIKAGGVLKVPDHIGAALIKQGAARPREMPGPQEKKGARLVPGDPLPPAAPYIRVPAPPQPAAGFDAGLFEDQDNFVRNLETLTATGPFGWWPWASSAGDAPPVTQSPSASTRTPLLTLDDIKLHCHIESDQTDEDPLLEQYELAARIHAENYLGYQIDTTASVGENIKQASLMLIAHWYRNREAVSTGRGSVGAEMPLAYLSLLGLERDYPSY